MKRRYGLHNFHGQMSDSPFINYEQAVLSFEQGLNVWVESLDGPMGCEEDDADYFYPVGIEYGDTVDDIPTEDGIFKPKYFLETINV
jgi:hypothetical protein